MKTQHVGIGLLLLLLAVYALYLHCRLEDSLQERDDLTDKMRNLTYALRKLSPTEAEKAAGEAVLLAYDAWQKKNETYLTRFYSPHLLASYRVPEILRLYDHDVQVLGIHGSLMIDSDRVLVVIRRRIIITEKDTGRNATDDGYFVFIMMQKPRGWEADEGLYVPVYDVGFFRPTC